MNELNLKIFKGRKPTLEEIKSINWYNKNPAYNEKVIKKFKENYPNAKEPTLLIYGQFVDFKPEFALVAVDEYKKPSDYYVIDLSTLKNKLD